MKNILVVGGTGTISRPVVELLAQDSSKQVFVLNRGNKNNQLPKNVQSIICDYQDSKKLDEVLNSYDFDVVINFILYMPQEASRDLHLFKGRIKQYIFISTVASLNHEFSLYIDENTETLNRFSNYGLNKSRCESLFLSDKEFPLTIVRPSQTYSEHRIPLSVKGKEYWPVVQRMLEGKEVIVHGDGQSVWASTHADDFAKFFVALVANPSAIHETYQIMNNQLHTWDKIYQELARHYGVEYKPVYISKDILRESSVYDLQTSIQGDKHFSNIYDTSKIRALNPNLDFDIGIEEGIQKFVEYMELNPDLKVSEPGFDEWCDTLIKRYKLSVRGMMKGL